MSNNTVFLRYVLLSYMKRACLASPIAGKALFFYLFEKILRISLDVPCVPVRRGEALLRFLGLPLEWRGDTRLNV